MGGGNWDVEIGENSEVRIQNSEERNRTQMTQICADQKVTEMMDEMFIVVLEEQVECYRRLEKLAGAQHEHVQQGSTEGLIAVLEQRQAVVSRIMELERALGPAKREWRKSMEKGRVEELLAESKRLLERITEADRDDAMVLQQRKLNLGRQIKAAATARAVNRNYATAAYGSRASTMDVQR